jgi:hypothetical protein
MLAIVAAAVTSIHLGMVAIHFCSLVQHYFCHSCYALHWEGSDVEHPTLEVVSSALFPCGIRVT